MARSGRATGPGAISVLLAASGLLMVAGAAQRWWPTCHVGPYDTPACLRAQFSGRGLVPPLDPWGPPDHAAVLAGLALLCLGTAVAGLPLLLRRGRRPRYAWLLCGTIGASQLLAGTSTLGSALLAQPGPHLWVPLVVFVRLGWPVALVLTAMLLAGHVRGPGGGWVLLIALVSASTPLVQAFLAPALTGYRSADVTPWSEAWGGAALLLAALAVWPAAYGRRRHRRPTPAVAVGGLGRPAVVGAYRPRAG